MKCFAHTSSDAVAICKHCSKGACPACIIDTANGVACSEACAEQVELVASLISSNAAASKINRRGAAYLMPVFFIFMGLAFIGHAAFTGRSGGSLVFALVLGSGFVAVGIALGTIQLVWQRRSAGRI